MILFGVEIQSGKTETYKRQVAKYIPGKWDTCSWKRSIRMAPKVMDSHTHVPGTLPKNSNPGKIPPRERDVYSTALGPCTELSCRAWGEGKGLNEGSLNALKKSPYCQQGRWEATRSHFLAGWRPGNPPAAAPLGWDRRTRFRKVKTCSNETEFFEIRKNRPAFRKQELAKISRTGRQCMQNVHR